MKIFKYQFNDISTGIHKDDVTYLLYNDMLKEFTETLLQLKVHTIDDDSFFFISDIEDQKKMIEILTNVEDLKEAFGDFKTTYTDMTDEILSNIDNYDSIENFNDKNTLLKYYMDVYTPNAILDKIIEKGINSLSERDKIILQESVK